MKFVQSESDFGCRKMTSVQDSPGLTLKVFHVDNSLDGIHCKGRSLGETSFWPDRTVILVPCAECLEAGRGFEMRENLDSREEAQTSGFFRAPPIPSGVQ